MYNSASFIILLVFLASCTTNSNRSEQSTSQKKIGVLLVNHGSRSATWRQTLLDLDSSVRNTIMENPAIAGVKTAFMEYTEPSIATQLKKFDEEGFSDIIIVPIFLTISAHSFDDIPTIIGQKTNPSSEEMLKLEKIEVYKPEANCHITPLLDFANILRLNVLNRARSLSSDPAREGLVLIAYGDEGYNREWSALMDSVGTYVCREMKMSAYSYGWCGHIVRYDPLKTTVAINRVLAEKEKALVVPVLVARDEMFQVKIIGDGINAIDNHNHYIAYKPDAILPDENVESWIIDIVSEYTKKIESGDFATKKS